MVLYSIAWIGDILWNDADVVIYTSLPVQEIVTILDCKDRRVLRNGFLPSAGRLNRHVF